MSEQLPIVPDKISIQGIRILAGNITSDPTAQQVAIKGYEVLYGATDEFFYEKKLFRFVFNVNISALDANDKSMPVNCQYSIEYVFFVENLDDYILRIDSNDKTVTLQHILPATLLGMVYSTSRGIILSRTQGTLLEGVILPVIDIYSLLKNLEKGKQEKRTFEIEPVSEGPT